MAVSLFVAACGSSAGMTDAGPDAASVDGGAGDASFADDVPPEIRDVRAALESPTVTFDLGSGSSSRQIFSPSSLEVRVFASDDVTPAESLTVELVDPAVGSAYADASAAFQRGLWVLSHQAGPGTAFTVAVTDAAGNRTELGNTLTFPSLADGVARSWTALQYDDSQTLVSQVEEHWMDGQFCHVDAGGRGGTYAVDGDTLTVEERFTTACGTDPGTDADTVERTVESALYVDDVYFAFSRFDRDGDGTGATGTWTRSSAVTDSGGTSTMTAETLTLSAEGAFQRSTDDGATTSTESGTYEVITNSDYTFDYGDFLVLTIESRDGAALSTPETEQRWFVVRDGHLLIEPLVDLSAN